MKKIISFLFFSIATLGCRGSNPNQKTEVAGLEDANYKDPYNRTRSFYFAATIGQAGYVALVPLVCREPQEAKDKEREVFFYHLTADGLKIKNLPGKRYRWLLDHFYNVYNPKDTGEPICEVIGDYAPHSDQVLVPHHQKPSLFSKLGPLGCLSSVISADNIVEEGKKIIQPVIGMQGGNWKSGVKKLGFSILTNPKAIAAIASWTSGLIACLFHLENLVNAQKAKNEKDTLSRFTEYLGYLNDDVSRILSNAPSRLEPYLKGFESNMKPSKDESTKYIEASVKCLQQQDGLSCRTQHNMFNLWFAKIFNFIQSSDKHLPKPYSNLGLNTLLSFKNSHDLALLIANQASGNNKDAKRCSTYILNAESSFAANGQIAAIPYECDTPQNNLMDKFAEQIEKTASDNTKLAFLKVDRNDPNPIIFNSDNRVSDLIVAFPKAYIKENHTGSLYLRPVVSSEKDGSKKCYLIRQQELIPLGSSCL